MIIELTQSNIELEARAEVLEQLVVQAGMSLPVDTVLNALCSPADYDARQDRMAA
ncbi:hypothetical protein JAO10_32965 [Burkholderia contaminans]|uniref:hypothetical protein n=1 Tax=Burkholderia contaminans TaxID=488447 RepID=UPI0018DD19F8|nr:hypothetical protein [Burkholderia contaminans]MBH9725144.1 hypothetical protein [Burkholderia contaminans]